MEEKAVEIIQKSVSLFMKYGIKSVTMDDVAKELMISKKTLYKYFKNKNELVKATVEMDCGQDECIIDSIINKSENAIDQIIEIAKVMSVRLKDIHPSIIYDMQKYYPEAWIVFENHKKIFVFNEIEGNLKRGISEGFYRDNLNVEIIARLFSEKIDTVINGEIFPPEQYNFSEVYLEMIRYHIRGIASDKGVQYLTKRIENESIKF